MYIRLTWYRAQHNLNIVFNHYVFKKQIIKLLAY